MALGSNRRWAFVAGAGMAIVLCAIVLISSSSSSSSVSASEKWDAVVGKTGAAQCDSDNQLVTAMHSSFVKVSSKLLDLKGRMTEALKEDDCSSVVDLAAKLQQCDSEFDTLKEEYEHLDPADQQAVSLCFDETLFPQSTGVQEYAVHSLSQCGNSNPLVAQANALIDAAASQAATEAAEVQSRDCVGLATLMDAFTDSNKQFDSQLSSILSKLTEASMHIEVKLITITADHKLLKAADTFYEAWENKWGSFCTGDVAASDDDHSSGSSDDTTASSDDEASSSGGSSDDNHGAAAAVVATTPAASAAPAPSADDDAVDHAAGGADAATTTSTHAAAAAAAGTAGATQPAGVAATVAGTAAAVAAGVATVAGGTTAAAAAAAK